MTEAEEILSGEELAERYNRQITRATALGCTPDDLAQLSAELTHLLSWRAERQSPGRCLDCGSTKVALIPIGLGESVPAFPHPGCGGELSFQWRDHYHPGWDRWVYSPEGERLEEQARI